MLLASSITFCVLSWVCQTLALVLDVFYGYKGSYGAGYGQCIKAIKRNEEKDAKEGLCLLVTENPALEEETVLEEQERGERRKK